MRKAFDLIGLPVMNTTTGEEIGRVKDLLLNEQWAFEGFVLEPNGWLRKGKYIPLNQVNSVGEDAVMVDNEQCIQSLDHTEHLFGLTTGSPKIKGMSVLTQDGDQLGQIEDVYFLEEMGTLVGYELSNGLISDLTEGRKIIRPTHVTLGEDAVIIPVSSENDDGI